MKAVNVTELKAHLSKYLRMASRGQRIIVKDRDEAIAQLGPLQDEPLSWRDRMASQGRLRPGTQAWGKRAIVRLDTRVEIQSSLQAVREDASEVRRH